MIVHVGNEGGITLRVHRPLAMLVVPRGIVDVIRLVRGVIAEEKEEGVVPVPMDEGDSIVGRNLRIVAHMGIVGILFDMDEAVVPKTIIGIVIRRVAVNGGNGPTIKLVETTMVRS